MTRFWKTAEDSSLDSSTGATAGSPLPTPSIEPTFAPGKRGPNGMSPRQNYSRVNTGAPPQADAGASEQKSMAPRGAEMLPKRASVAGEKLMGKMAGRPVLQDLVKAAMVDSAARVRVTEEAYYQSEKIAEKEKCSKCGKMKCACGDYGMKSASASQHVIKLASALDYIAQTLVKESANLAGPYGLTEHLQESPPGVTHAMSSTSLPDHKGEGVHIVPMHPGQQKAMKQEHGGTQMENTQDHAPHLHQEMMETNYGKKAASVADLVRWKLAEKDPYEAKEDRGIRDVKKGLREFEEAHAREPENKAAHVDYAELHARQLAGKPTAGQMTAAHEARQAATRAHAEREASKIQGISGGIGGHGPAPRGPGGLTTGEAEALLHAQAKKAPVSAAVHAAEHAAPAAVHAAEHAAPGMARHLTGRNAALGLGGLALLGAGTYGVKKLHDRRKHASLADYMRAKVAEDAINPAQISAGPAVPPDTSMSGEPGGAPVGGAPQGPTNLVASADAARGYTKGQAYSNRREDLKKYFAEPALSSAHDKTLQVAFENTGAAGPKIASAPASSVKTAAARVLLSQLADSINSAGK